MRLVSLFIIFFVALYNFLPRQAEEQSIDSVKTKLASLRKAEPVARVKPSVGLKPAAGPQKIVEAQEDVSADEITSHEDETYADKGSAENIPWDEIEKGWEAEVKEALIRLEPEDGEAIYNAYLSEKENHKSEIDALFSENSKGERSRAPSLVPQESDDALGALDQRHDERLKEILGVHYEEITKRHQEYLESIQHLNRENADAEIGVFL